MSGTRKKTLIMLLAITLILIGLTGYEAFKTYSRIGELQFKDVALLISLCISGGLFVFALFRR